jgi:hypothetical protein
MNNLQFHYCGLSDNFVISFTAITPLHTYIVESNYNKHKQTNTFLTEIGEQIVTNNSVMP